MPGDFPTKLSNISTCLEQDLLEDPPYTHLLALKCAEVAVLEGRTSVGASDLKPAMAAAVKDVEQPLRTSYDNSTRSATTDMYESILLAAALIKRTEFTAKELRESILAVTGKPITQLSLNNYFERLVSNDGTFILRRVGKGIYRFADPRMPGFVMIANSRP